MSPRTWQADVIKESEPFFLFPIFRTKEIQEELEMTKQALEKLQDIREKETEMVSVISCNFCSVVKWKMHYSNMEWSKFKDFIYSLR